MSYIRRPCPSDFFFPARFDFHLTLLSFVISYVSVDESAHVAIHTNRGASMVRLGRYEEALEVYNQVLQMDPDRIEAWQNTGLGKYLSTT